MTLDEIINEVKFIELSQHDPEVAHSAEDRLHVDFIEFVAKSDHSQLSDMAKEILKTNDLDFARWCA